MTKPPRDHLDFDEQVAPYRAELHAHCYRMLGSVHDADDERLAKRPRRRLTDEHSPPAQPNAPMGEMLREPLWIEPYPDDPSAAIERLENVELAFVAALQHLPATQRSALLLHDVVGLSAAEVADALETSVAAVNSALSRARAAIAERVPEESQRTTLRALGDERTRALAAAYVRAWEAGDVDGLRMLLTDDVRFTMPPLPNWFDGREDVLAFFEAQIFPSGPWRLRPTRANGQLAFACYQGPELRLGALNVVTIRGSAVSSLTGFLDPAIHDRFSLPSTDEFSATAHSRQA